MNPPMSRLPALDISTSNMSMTSHSPLLIPRLSLKSSKASPWLWTPLPGVHPRRSCRAPGQIGEDQAPGRGIVGTAR